jgi:hypothetical protein
MVQSSNITEHSLNWNYVLKNKETTVRGISFRLEWDLEKAVY